jgi:hypothetical protein
MVTRLIGLSVTLTTHLYLLPKGTTDWSNTSTARSRPTVGCTAHNIFISAEMVRVNLQACILEVMGSNLGRNTGYPA